jgi:hypothetical protein
LVSLGVVGRRRRIERDWIAEALAALYGCDGKRVWRELLGTEYEHAHQMLVEAKARFAGAYSEWLSLQDGFGDISIRKFFDLLRAKGLSGHSLTVGGNGKLVDYGTLLQVSGPFDRAYPAVAASLRTLHERRNKLPGSHPYDKKGGTKNRWLTKRERDVLIADVTSAMDAIAAACEANR